MNKPINVKDRSQPIKILLMFAGLIIICAGFFTSIFFLEHILGELQRNTELLQQLINTIKGV